MTSSFIGSRQSTQPGRGSTLRDHRQYADGDDFRLIDWKVFARTDHMYIKRFEEERSLTVHVIVDKSDSMNFGDKVTKFDYAGMIGVGFAYLAMKENEKFRFCTFSDDIEIFSLRRGMAHLAQMIEHLNKAKTKGGSNFLECMRKYKKTLGSRSLIVVVSDFLVDYDQIEEGLALFSNHDLKVIQVLDAQEKALALEGDLKLKDLETNQEIQTFITPQNRQQYLGKLDEHIAKIEKLCMKLDADYSLVITDKPVFESFFDILRSVKR
ncbi:MAG: DUF58 domain-containing protein [Nanoarchaeota archaeon]